MSGSGSTSGAGVGVLVGRPIRQLTWDDRSHWRVLTQAAGSVWPRVLPYCLLNVAVTYGVYLYFQQNHPSSSSNSSATSGHKYMSMLMAFLVVTRVKITYDNYMQNANNVAQLYESIRGLVQEMCIMTANDTSRHAKQWRQDVAYASIVLLRVSISVLEYKSNPNVDPWAVAAELERRTKFQMSWCIEETQQQNNMKPNGNRINSSSSATPYNVAAQAILRQTENDESWQIVSTCHAAQQQKDQQHCLQESIQVLEDVCRVPITLAFNARREILKQRDAGCRWLDRKSAVWKDPSFVVEELRLCDYVGSFIQAYHGLRKLIVASQGMPFPLVQMAKTMLFIWLYSLPLALCHGYDSTSSSSSIASLLGLIFLITFGFIGLEFVAMELTDPFGEDPSDFDALGHAQMAFEDCYIAIYKLDGGKWAAALRQRVMDA
jgi:predicted membrane chloride channel (bestrophin family)